MSPTAPMPEELPHSAQLNRRVAELEAELARVKHDLAESKGAYKVLLKAVDRIGDIFFVVDREWRYRYINPDAARLIQSAPEEIVGKALWEVIPDFFGSVYDVKFRQAIESQTPVVFESHSPRTGNWYETRAYPSVHGLSVYGRDITARKQAVEALHESENKFRAIFDRAVSGILLVDPSRNYLEFNQALCRILGGTREELLERSSQFFPAGSESRLQEIEMQLQQEGYWHGELPLLDIKGNSVDLEWWVSDLVEPHLRLAIVNDITQRKQNEKEREQLLNQLAEERAQLKEFTELLEIRVHERTQEVRTLAAQLSLVEQAERKRIAHILHDHVQQMLYGVQWRAHLMEQDISTTSAAHLSEHLAEMDRLTREAIRAMRTLTVELSPPVLENEGLPEALAWLAVQMQEVHALKVNVDVQTYRRWPNKNLKMLIFQIVRELLFNVVKHAGVNEVFVTLHQQNACLHVIVLDHGKGFDATAISRDKNDTSGFGLASIHERLELFGGRIEIHTQPGAGTKITLLLPLTGELESEGTEA